MDLSPLASLFLNFREQISQGLDKELGILR